MTIAVFGGTGKTGGAFLRKALAAGHQVRALVRDAGKISKANNLSIIVGDVLDPQTVAQTVQGADLVVSLFGHVKGSPEWLQTNGTENIISAMKQHGVNRILSLSGGGLPYQKDEPKLVDKMIRGIMKLVVPRILNDAIRHAEVLKNSGLDWMIVRGPRLTNKPGKGSYRVGWVGVNASTSISREDLADFILAQTESWSFSKQMPFVSE